MRRSDLRTGRDYLFSPNADWAVRVPRDRPHLNLKVRRARLLDATQNYIDLRPGRRDPRRAEPKTITLPNGDEVLALAEIGAAADAGLVLIHFVDRDGNRPEREEFHPAWAVKPGLLRGEWEAALAMQT